MTAVISAENQVNTWIDKDFRESWRGDPFVRLRGTSKYSPIHVGREKEGKKTGGTLVTRTLVDKWDAEPIMDDNMLRGSETSTRNRAKTVTLRQYRMADIIGSHERRKAAFDMVESIEEMARMWGGILVRDLTIDRIASLDSVNGVKPYIALTDAERNTWAAAQNPSTTNQRGLYGTSQANYSGVHATDLAQIDNTNDEMHQDIARHIRRMVQSCDPYINPARSSKAGDAGGNRYHCPLGSRAFRDLETNMEQIHMHADKRGQGENHLFTNGVIWVGNTEFFEVPEMDRSVENHGATIENVGAGATVDVQVTRVFGGQAMILELGTEAHEIEEKDDYGNLLGKGLATTFALENATYNGVDRGMGTLFVAAEPD